MEWHLPLGIARIDTIEDKPQNWDTYMELVMAMDEWYLKEASHWNEDAAAIAADVASDPTHEFIQYASQPMKTQAVCQNERTEICDGAFLLDADPKRAVQKLEWRTSSPYKVRQVRERDTNGSKSIRESVAEV